MHNFCGMPHGVSPDLTDAAPWRAHTTVAVYATRPPRRNGRLVARRHCIYMSAGARRSSRTEMTAATQVVELAVAIVDKAPSLPLRVCS